MIRPLAKVSFGLFYGAVIAGSYLVAKLAGSNGGVNVVCVSSLILFLFHLLIWPKLTFVALTERENVLRAILFSVTQIFLFKAQSSGSTSSMLIAGIAGTIVGSVLGRLILKEVPDWLDVFAIIIGILAILIGNENLSNNLWALTGGIIQGVTAVVTRSLMRKKASRRGCIASGFFFMFITMLIVLVVTRNTETIVALTMPGLTATIFVMLLAQYAFFQLYKLYDTQKAAVISLLRVPWAVVLELIVIGTVISTTKLISSAVIILAAAVSLIHHARKTAKNRAFL
jgi:drug/metabolite transporter (DMT)-like permease